MIKNHVWQAELGFRGAHPHVWSSLNHGGMLLGIKRLDIVRQTIFKSSNGQGSCYSANVIINGSSSSTQMDIWQDSIYLFKGTTMDLCYVQKQLILCRPPLLYIFN